MQANVGCCAGAVIEGRAMLQWATDRWRFRRTARSRRTGGHAHDCRTAIRARRVTSCWCPAGSAPRCSGTASTISARPMAAQTVHVIFRPDSGFDPRQPRGHPRPRRRACRVTRSRPRHDALTGAPSSAPIFCSATCRPRRGRAATCTWSKKTSWSGAISSAGMRPCTRSARACSARSPCAITTGRSTRPTIRIAFT